MVLWSDGSRVRAAFRLNGGPFLAGHVVPGVRFLDARRTGVLPLITPTGEAMVTWPGDLTSTLVAHAPRGGPFYAPQRAPAPNGFGALAFSPDGHGAILVPAARGLSVALGEPDGRWGAPQRLATERVRNSRVAVGDDGGVVVAWTASGGCAPQLPHTVVPQCQFLRVAMRPPGGSFGPNITLEAAQGYVGPPQPVVDAAGRPVVIWRHVIARVDATLLAPGTFFGGFAAPATLPGTDHPTTDACPPANAMGAAPDPRVVAVRPRPDGGAFALIDRDEGCGPLLSEIPLGPDGTAGTATRLTAAPLAPKLGMDLIGLGGRTPALVTRTAAGAVAVARTAPRSPWRCPRTRGVARRRCCAMAGSSSRSRAPAARAPTSPRRSWWRPTRRPPSAGGLSHCGDPSPAMIDRTGRAVFVARRNGDLVGWATAPMG